MALKQKIIILVSIFSALFLLWQYFLFRQYQKYKTPECSLGSLLNCRIGTLCQFHAPSAGQLQVVVHRCQPYLSFLFKGAPLSYIDRKIAEYLWSKEYQPAKCGKNLAMFDKTAPIKFPKNVCGLILYRFSDYNNLGKAFSQMSDLRYLSIQDSHLSKLPPEIGQLTELRQLSVTGYSSSLKLEILPPEISGLGNLEILQLASTNLQAIPESVSTLPKLRLMILADNPRLDQNQIPESLKTRIRKSLPQPEYGWIIQKLTSLFIAPTPTPTLPPLSNSYSLCQTDICKKILKNQETARVIVGVKLPRPTPVNWLQDPKLEEQLKQDIAQAISQVIQQLKPETQKSARPFNFIPYFALTADQPTLDFLATHPQVTSIEEEQLNQPSAIF